MSRFRPPGSPKRNRDRMGASDPWAVKHSALTPEGRIEMAGRFARGVNTLRGKRLFVTLFVLAFGILAMFMIATALGGLVLGGFGR